jgi:hypothetical protein
MSTKFDIEVTLVELINNNFLLLKIVAMKNFVDYMSIKCFASARVATPRLAPWLRNIPLTLAKYHFLD